MDQLVNFVIRPPRAQYEPLEDLLGPHFAIKGRRYRRDDLNIVNARGHILMCSFYRPYTVPEGVQLPCVIYNHGNSGCRCDANEAVCMLLPSNITVFAYDFSGSGLSEGEYVSLGYYEKEDLRAVVEYLRLEGKTSKIGLWGRSMGAHTCLQYAAGDPSIAGMVCDSPFSRLHDLMLELTGTYRIRVPKSMVKMALQYMRKLIQKKAAFDIMELDVLKSAPSTFIPVLFGHARGDMFIPPHHSQDICKLYAGDKNIIEFEGDHNSARPRFYYDSISIFFINVLQPPDLPGAAVTDFVDDGAPEDISPEQQSLLYELMAHPGARPEYEDPATVSQLKELEGAAEPTGEDAPQEDLLHQSGRRWQMTQTVLPDVEPGQDAFWDDDPEMTGFLRRQSAGEDFAPLPSSSDAEEEMLMAAIAASLAETSLGEGSGEADTSGEAGKKVVDQLVGPTVETPLTSNQASAASQKTELRNGVTKGQTSI